ncbi:uncharacterized protein KY384_000566 [Bacidia gigantensis]|uniref:uncharacterized protein n=1 Tax=Bacidia gigantensis TaxID=2732470 RepID=UPI001D03C17F|nr:uncharacterized protein KY384_000566 [Bacidia gigantensis]KAG8525806.1 hypothetical protein KY384_000566 [Bacidia gigantensis]
MPVSQAKVKSTLSGDTLVLSSVNNPEQERILSLAFVSAPRLRKEGDEPFAFRSRDYLRRLTVGKVIQFAVLYTIPTGAKRDYGCVFLQSGEVLPEAAVSEGWLKLRDDATRKNDSDESKDLLDKLIAQEEKARSAGKGLWSTKGESIATSYELPDSKAFADRWKGKSLDSIVEKVISGDRMIVRLMISATEHLQTMVVVAGIKAPPTKRISPTDGKEQAAEPFGNEAYQFVEQRLTQRTVRTEVLGVTPQGGLVCNVIHPNGSIAEFLLKAGLARCVDFHSTMLGGTMATLRKTEKQARDAQLGLFRGLKAKSGGTTGDAVITRVQTADTVYIREKSNEDRRVSLSSIRQPKPTDPKQAPFQAEAKEFMRKKLIGKHVKVQSDGRKEASEGFEAKDVVTITLNDRNIALNAVEVGYASVIRHRQDDTDRSPAYDDLLAAEATAQAEKKGMWSEKPGAAKNYQDYSESLQKAKIQSSVLSRQKRIPAIVDYVKGGSRFTVIIPRENAKLTFVLSGIRAPRSARNANEKSEPFGQEAHDFATRRCMQRDAEVDIETVDKVGGFIGTLYVNRENFAKLLVEEGLASVHAYSAEQSGHSNDLFAAEESAKQAQKGIWQDYDPTVSDDLKDLSLADQPDANGANEETVLKKDYRDVLVTHIDPTNLHLKVQTIGTSTSGALAALMSAFASHHRSPPSSEKSLPNPPKAGEYVSGRFSEDQEWYRARIRRNDREAKKAEVVFIDYGNSETLPWNELRPLVPQGPFSVQKLKAQAVDAGLSYLQFPTSKEYMEDAVRLLQDLTDGKQLVASVDSEEKEGTLWVTLFDPQKEGGEEESINAEVVEEGCAMIGRKLRTWEGRRGKGKLLDGLRKREEIAKEGKRGMWEYGDISED